MSDQFIPSPTAARAILSRKGPLTPDKDRAAEYYAAMHKVEPWWPLWLAADITVVLAALLAPLAMARGAIVLYAGAYAVSMVLRTRGNSAQRVLAQANPGAWAEMQARGVNLSALGKALAVLVLAAGGLACLLPSVPLRILAGAFGLFIARHAYRRITTHLRAKKVLTRAPDESWWPEYVADRELRAAAAEVLVNP